MYRFGAEVAPNGTTEFRLWAPAAHAVELLVEGSAIELSAEDDGWFCHRVVDAGPGTRYRYRIDGKQDVPDPASRFQPEDCEGASEVIDHASFEWHDQHWRGRPWAEAVIYELHVG